MSKGEMLERGRGIGGEGGDESCDVGGLVEER